MTLPPNKVNPVLRAEEMDVVLLYLPCNVLGYAVITSWTKSIPENVFYVLWICDMTFVWWAFL